MQDQYFGTKQLYNVVLKALVPMNFGVRQIEQGEPVLCFEKVSIATLNEQSRPILARGGWGNMPRIIWQDRSQVTFSLSEGVMSSVGMGILTSAKVLANAHDGALYLPRQTKPFSVGADGFYQLQYQPAENKKIFCHAFSNGCIQNKKEFIVYNDKRIKILNPSLDEEYVVNYYYRYTQEALCYLIEKERFNGLFSLQAKFYSKDENDGLDYTNVLFMPKVRIVSGINLRLGERADPMTSVFNIVAMPEKTEDSQALITKIIRLNVDEESVF